MKKIIFTLILIMLFFNCSNVFAIEECTDSEIARLKELANNVQFKTNYEISTNEEEIEDVTYKSVELIYGIDFINFDKDLKIVYNSGEDTESFNYKTTNIGGLAEGTKAKFSIYSYTTNMCTEKLLKTVTVDLPYYNDYYYFNKDKCNEHSDFKYCKEFVNTSEYDFEEIDEMFDEYLKKENSITNVIFKNNTIWYILGGIGSLGIVIIAITIVIKKRKNKDEL